MPFDAARRRDIETPCPRSLSLAYRHSGRPSLRGCVKHAVYSGVPSDLTRLRRSRKCGDGGASLASKVTSAEAMASAAFAVQAGEHSAWSLIDVLGERADDPRLIEPAVESLAQAEAIARRLPAAGAPRPPAPAAPSTA